MPDFLFYYNGFFIKLPFSECKPNNMAGFEKSRRHGKFWDDVKKLHNMINRYPFNSTAKNENSFEHGIASVLMSNDDNFNSEVITQIHKKKAVRSVYCFGKSHRPDMALGENVAAVELKFITYEGLKTAIGQGYIYRLQYRFVFLILVISEKRKSIYEDIANGKEKELESILQHLADEMNIFTYIVPAFNIKTVAMKKCISFFEPLNQ